MTTDKKTTATVTDPAAKGGAARRRLRHVSSILQIVVALAITLSLGAENTTKIARVPTQIDQTIAQVVVRVLEKRHYKTKTIETEISKIFYDEYFERLDPNRYYFLATDIAQFQPYKLILDDFIKNGKLDFAFAVYDRFLERIEERVEYATKRLKEPFDFEVDEGMLLTRKKAPWAANRTELDEVWRKRLKNQILIGIIAKERKKIQEQKEKVKDDPDAKPKEEEDPREKLLRSYRQYYEYKNKYDNADILEDYLTTLANVMDPHSTYMNWRTLEDFNIAMRLRLQGIGATLSSKDGYTKVVSIIQGGPADKDGTLQPNDFIIAVGQGDDKPMNVIDMPLKHVVRKIRGPKGTVVRLTVVKERHGVPSEVTIVRDEVKLKEQEAKVEVLTVPDADGKELKIGVIDLRSFYADFEGLRKGLADAKSTSRDVRRLTDAMIADDKIDGIIFDLRSNGGGSLEEAINLSGLFIPKGPMVQIRFDDNVRVRHDDDKGFAYDLPMVVLVNRLSASASEIFAGAIQDYGRGIIVGNESTHGKGTVQTIYNLRNIRVFKDDTAKPGAVKYTNAKFYRVTGASTQKRGITPDIILPSFFDHMDIGESSLDHVLPWDEIAAQQYTASKPGTRKYLLHIAERSKKRVGNNPSFTQLKVEIARYVERKKRNTISINKEKRIAAMKEEEAWAKRRESMLGTSKSKPNKDKDKDKNKAADPDAEPEDEEADDLYMIEGLHIVADLIDAVRKEQSLAHKDAVGIRDEESAVK